MVRVLIDLLSLYVFWVIDEVLNFSIVFLLLLRYVSTIDNTRNHGPGGQKSYAVLNEADPCFGKVIDGFDAITRLQKEKVKPGGYKGMVKPVTIEYAILI